MNSRGDVVSTDWEGFSGYGPRLVDELSRQEVATKAGVDPEYVDRLVELGMITPGDGEVFTSSDVLRARWIRSLEGAGVPLDGMAAAVRDGALSFSYLDLSAFDRFADLTGRTFQQLSEETGISLELLSVVRESFGYPEPTPQDHVHEGELSVIAAVEFQISKGYRPVVIERWLRVYTQTASAASPRRRRTRTGVRLSCLFLETGMSEGEMLDAQAHLGSEMGPLIEPALLAIYHGQQEHAWTKGTVEDVEGALERAGLHSRLHTRRRSASSISPDTRA
jgi:DNA-binding transcriptional MerR regulator